MALGFYYWSGTTRQKSATSLDANRERARQRLFTGRKGLCFHPKDKKPAVSERKKLTIAADLEIELQEN